MQNGVLPMPEGAPDAFDQDLSADQRAFVESAYALFEQFRRATREQRDEIRSARAMYELRDEHEGSFIKGRRVPQLNTLNSTIDNMVADYLDNMPEAVMTPERPDMQMAAEDITDVVAWVLRMAGMRGEWRRAVIDATVTGTGVMQIFWDGDKLAGGVRGNVCAQAWPPENWLPDPVYEDFRDGRAVFKYNVRPMSYFYQVYPKLAGCIRADARLHADRQDLGGKDDALMDDPLVALIEMWYRRYDPAAGRWRLHMAKFAGGALLYDSREEFPDGVYEHGEYPFIALRFRERSGTPYGSGMIHEFAETQRMINRYVKYMDDNARAASKLRLLVNKSAGISVSQAADLDQDVLEGQRIDDGALRFFQATPMGSQVMNMMTWLQETEKQDSGQNQFSRGEAGLGVTAASAISMLQEAGGKISRMHTAMFMDAFRQAVEQILSLIAQFFGEGRILMITGEDGSARPVAVFGELLRGSRDLFAVPAYSVQVNVQRTNPQQVQARNEQVLKIAEICAQAGTPLSARAIVNMLSMSGKREILEAVDGASQPENVLPAF